MKGNRFPAMPFEKWPVRDRGLWLSGMMVGDPLDEPRIAAHWRSETRALVQRAYAVGLKWLQRNGRLDDDELPGMRWTPERLSAYIADLKCGLRPATVKHCVVNMERALAVLAPNSDRSMWRVAVARLAYTPDRSHKRARLRDPAELVELGLELMRSVEESDIKPGRKKATVYRVGLQVALLAMRPLRKKNFASIRIGHHLVRKGKDWELQFSRPEMKNGPQLTILVPDSIQPFLDRYLAVYRPLLCGGRYRGDRLWVGYRFAPQAAHTLQLSIVRVTKRAFGAPINPHLFRDCAATSIAIHDPESVRMASIILGHASFGTTEKYYNLANSLQAGRAYSNVLEELRLAERSRSFGGKGTAKIPSPTRMAPSKARTVTLRLR